MTLQQSFTGRFAAFAFGACVASIADGATAAAYDMNAVVGPSPYEVPPCASAGGAARPPAALVRQAAVNEQSPSHVTVAGTAVVSVSRSYCNGRILPLILGASVQVSLPINASQGAQSKDTRGVAGLHQSLPAASVTR